MSRDRWADDLKVLGQVLTAWYEASAEIIPPIDSAAAYRDEFPELGNGDPTPSIKKFRAAGAKERWFPVQGYFRARPVSVKTKDDLGTRIYWPLTTFRLRVGATGRLDLDLRVVMYWAVNTDVDAWGWRFDSPDDAATATEHTHPYFHVQHISNWEPGLGGFQPPGWPARGLRLETYKDAPEQRPAFPLGCRSAAGLTAAALLSIYGPVVAARILEAVPQVEAEFTILTGRVRSDFA